MNTPSPRRNPAASVRQRLLNRARQTGEDFNLVLTRYAVERLLFRLSQSRYRPNFILKGAMLLAVWRAERHRPTRDLDLTGYGSDSAEELTAAFREIVELPVEPDGLEFDRDGITVSEIREDQEYHGKRVVIPARLGTARTKVQVDIGFGDVVVPEPQELSFPTLLGSPSPRIRAYPPEAVNAREVTRHGPPGHPQQPYEGLLRHPGHLTGALLQGQLSCGGDRRHLRTPAHTAAVLCSGRPYRRVRERSGQGNPVECVPDA